MNIYILTFAVTALYDVVLRLLSENYDKTPSFLQMDFVLYLQPYFEKHTLLAAALIAGFVGATAQFIILNLHKLPSTNGAFISFMTVTFTISALYGFLMKFSTLFPHLVNTYYKKLGVSRSMYTDGMSGIIVQSTVILILYLVSKLSNIDTSKVHPATLVPDM